VLIGGCVSRSGSPGIGDPYYRDLGNGGYDVTHYTITLHIDPPTNAISGSTQIRAQATRELASMNLDLVGLEVDSIKVDGQAALFSHQGHELTVTPANPLSRGAAFVVDVAYHGNPQPIPNVASTLFAQVGWFHSETGAISVMSEPNGAAGWFPCNDHPRDKATYTFDITVPHPWVVAATGVLQDTIDSPDQMEYVWAMDQPMASYLASINIDRYVLESGPGPGGIIVRNYLTPDLSDSLKKRLDLLPAMLEYLSGLFGPYPFDEYGIVTAPADIPPCQTFGGAVETQSLAVHCPKHSMMEEDPLVHELAHQWFGDDVSIESWQDLWLKEGMATYSEWLWRTRDGGAGDLAKLVATVQMGFVQNVPIGAPPPDDIYDDEAYVGGAQVFHALRLQVGDEVFFKILREYLDRYRYGVAGTDEFVATAEEVSGLHLKAFFNSWLKTTELPDLPQP
jgi:aminopeptidase N